MTSKRSPSGKRSARDRGPKRPVSTPEETVIACEDEAIEALEEEIEEVLEEELAEEFEEEFEEEIEAERGKEYRLYFEHPVFDALNEASNALSEAEIAITAALGRVAETERQLTDAHAAGGKALDRVIFAINGVVALIMSEEPERGSAAISESPETGGPDDDEGGGPAEGKNVKSPENGGAKDAAAKSAEHGRPKAPESGIVAQARAVEREARALAETQRTTGDPAD